MAKKKTITDNKKTRTRKQPVYKSFRLSKRIRPAKKPLPGIWNLCKKAIFPLKKNKKLFLGIILIHFIFTIIFVGGIASSLDFVSTKDSLEQALGSDVSKSTSVFTLMTYLFSTNSASTSYQLFFSLIVSLAIIWSIRQVLAGEKIIIRQAFYQGIYPLVPFVTVLFVLALQLLPALLGNLLLSIVIGSGIAITFFEKAFFWIFFVLLLTLSVYMILSSIFALYISTLPDMTPMKALRSARGLVLHRRIPILLRLVGMVVVIGIVYGLILMPLIYLVPIVAVPVFLLLGSFSFYFINSYLYNLYRALI